MICSPHDRAKVRGLHGLVLRSDCTGLQAQINYVSSNVNVGKIDLSFHGAALLQA
jgi:hypothetical protein